jgi:cytochrome c peroxidase
VNTRGDRKLINTQGRDMQARKTLGGFALMALAGALIAAAGDSIVTPDEGDGIPPDFIFKPEVPFQSLKTVPTWPELERMLDDPYAMAACPNDANGNPVVGNAQGYAAQCTTIQRRRSFLPAGCTYDATTGLTPCNDALLPPFAVHPLNYNPMTGEQFRLLDPAFPGVADFAGRGPISAGSTRIAPGNPPAIDYNSPLVDDGGDPGEPDGYSGAAMCGDDPVVDWTEGRPQCAGNTGLLLDPTPQANGTPRGIVASLRKPSIGQNYLLNSTTVLAPNQALLRPSIPGDYIRDHDMATALGKALFWDMQLGSDGVQACASCHFSAGADTRVRNQLNPNHLGGDSDLELFRNRHLTTPPTAADQDVNRDIVASDFPTHRLSNVAIPGEPLLNPNNVTRDTNDVISSMGVRLRRFDNIRTPGSAAFGTANSDVRALLPELGVVITDEIPIFQARRRVEPRNTPSMINAAFSFDNFWDARGRHDFNGGSVFGASDPQAHVMVDQNGTIRKTRQLIRFSSLASQIVGPALSDFEMSFRNRNWAKIGKKLLQGDGTATRPNVTPLASQLVATTDSVMGPFSNQGGSQCIARGRPVAAGRPGLCLTYREMVQEAFFPTLWQNTTQHLDGATAVCTSAVNGVLTPSTCDPFDGFVLKLGAGPASPTNRQQFTQMESNFSLFVGLSMQAYVEILISDDTPFDRFLDRNPQAFRAFNTTMPLCGGSTPQPCLTQVEGFNRALPPNGTPDRLLGMDLFYGTNLTNRNPNFRSARCGNCHAAGTMSNNSIVQSHRLQPTDFTPDFITPGTKLARKPLGMPRLASGFLLEAMINGNAVSAVRRDFINPSFTLDQNNRSRPEGAAFIDIGMYNIGVRPTEEDEMHGGTDGFGWPLSLATLTLKNLGGTSVVAGTNLPTFDPEARAACAPDCADGGLFAPTAQDPLINPGFSGRPLQARLPSTLAPWISPVAMGKQHPVLDEIDGGFNTFTEVPLQDGFLDVLGPFNPQATLNMQANLADGPLVGTFPMVNRVGMHGGAKVPPLRNVELTGPYFHNGGKLTLRQVINFYAHGGDFPITNGPHRDFNIIDLDHDAQSVLSAADRVALTAFLLALTDERVAREQAPFDRPEIFLPVDGRAPDAPTGGRATLVTQSGATSGCGTAICFRRLVPIGAAGNAARLPSFLNVSRTVVAGTNNDHFDQ